MNNRIEYFDFMRGIAILFVIAIHTYGMHVAQNGMFHEGTLDFDTLIRIFIGCSVPIFLAISGYFMANKNLTTWKSYFDFEKKQIARVYLPCLVWSLPLFSLTLYKGGSILKGGIYFFAGGFSVYYFIALIIQLYLLLPLLIRYVNKYKWGGVICIFLFSLLAVTPLYYVHFILGDSLPLIVYAAPFPMWLIYFVLGIYFGRGNELKISRRIVSIVLVLIMGLSYINIQCIFEKYGAIECVGAGTFSWTILSTVTVLFLFVMKDVYRSNRFTKLICQLGDYSFGIYLIHMYVLGFGLNRVYPEMNWLLKVVVVALISSGMIWIGRKVSPTLSRKYLGF